MCSPTPLKKTKSPREWEGHVGTQHCRIRLPLPPPPPPPGTHPHLLLHYIGSASDGLQRRAEFLRQGMIKNLYQLNCGMRPPGMCCKACSGRVPSHCCCCGAPLQLPCTLAPVHGDAASACSRIILLFTEIAMPGAMREDSVRLNCAAAPMLALRPVATGDAAYIPRGQWCTLSDAYVDVLCRLISTEGAAGAARKLLPSCGLQLLALQGHCTWQQAAHGI